MNEFIPIHDYFWFENPNNPYGDGIEVLCIHYERENEPEIINQLTKILEEDDREQSTEDTGRYN